MTRLLGAAGLLTLAGSALGVGTQIVLARTAGSEAYGVYSYVLAWLLLLAVAGRMGFDVAALRLLPAYRTRGEWGRLYGFLRTSASVTLLASLGVSATMAAVGWILRSRLQPGVFEAFVIGAVILPILVQLLLAQAAARGLGQIAESVASEALLRPALLLVGVMVAARLTSVSGAVLIGLHGAAALAVLIVLVAVRRREFRQRPLARPETNQKREWLALAWPLLMMAAFHSLNARADILMVGSMLGTRLAGIYSAAYRVGFLAMWGLTIVNLVLPPLISRLTEEKRRADLQLVLRRAAAFIAAVTFPVTAALILLGPRILNLFGSEFGLGHPAMLLLILANAVNAMTGSVGFLLVMTGNHRVAAISIVLTGIVNIILNLLLIPRFGLTGAALATLVTTVIWNLSLYAIVRRRLGLDPSVLALVNR